MGYVIHWWIRKINGVAIPPDPYFEFKKKKEKKEKQL